MELTIGGKKYRFTYTVDASLCEECVEKTTSLMMQVGMAQDEQDLKKMLSGISNIPVTALSMFYAGLLEHHGTGRDGDKSIRSKDDAVDLIKQYFAENPEDENANFYGLLTMILEQMGEDGFFKVIGLETIFKQAEAIPQPNRAQRRAQAKAKA